LGIAMPLESLQAELILANHQARRGVRKIV
jgi:hypothetical protein